jgi:hypothetical protein
MPDNRFCLKLQGWLIIVCAAFTLVLGLIVWYDTLQTRAELNVVWGQESTAMQSLLQQAVSNLHEMHPSSQYRSGEKKALSCIYVRQLGGCSLANK